MRAIAALTLLAICLVSGCSTNGRSDSKPPIVGTWVLNIARTSPAAAANPALKKSLTGTMTFSSNGTYHASATFNGHTNEDSGRWRMVGSEVYVRPDEAGQEGHL